MFNECRIHLIQPQIGIRLGADRANERHIFLKLDGTRALALPPHVGGAMAEWSYFVQDVETYRGNYEMYYNNLNNHHPYTIGAPASGTYTRFWRYIPNANLLLHLSYWPAGSDQYPPENAVTLSGAVMDSKGFTPAAGQNVPGNGYVNVGSPLLHIGPVYWHPIFGMKIEPSNRR
jgi:hypothetical protein